jgi:hypothetical protein
MLYYVFRMTLKLVFVNYIKLFVFIMESVFTVR